MTFRSFGFRVLGLGSDLSGYRGDSVREGLSLTSTRQAKREDRCQALLSGHKFEGGFGSRALGGLKLQQA